MFSRGLHESDAHRRTFQMLILALPLSVYRRAVFCVHYDRVALGRDLVRERRAAASLHSTRNSPRNIPRGAARKEKARQSRACVAR
jgi:hypothetical protein